MNTYYFGDYINLLLGLAWFGEIGFDDLQRLWGPQFATDYSLRYALRELRREGYARRRGWAIARKNSPPARQCDQWSLSKIGHNLLIDHELYPPHPFERRSRLMLSHDRMTSHICTMMLAAARTAGLSGVYLEREVRLNPEKRRPIMDAILIMRTGGNFAYQNLVPWSRDPLLPGEKRRRYAIENDRDTEAISVIIGKAHAYREALANDWQTRYGGLPIPVWVVPSERRRETIMQAWRGAWPNGKWLITTDRDLEQDVWLEYYAGSVRTRRLYEPLSIAQDMIEEVTQ